MKLLRKKAHLDAELDSAARHTPPHCHPETRKDLRTRIISWLENKNRESNLLWLFGPAGVGKSAVAQTIAEECQKAGWLGGAFFFSRPRVEDPDRVIPSISHQLATTYPPYQRSISRLLTDDPSVLSKNLAVQFRKLITGPLLAMEAPSLPMLFIVDGLDECRGDTAQGELIQLIADFAGHCKSVDFPFLWMIVSRPEWQITSKFSILGIVMEKNEVYIDDEDAWKVLRDGFRDVRKKYGHVFGEQMVWPTEPQLLTLRSAASGLMAFVSTLLKFVDDEEAANPASQLDACLEFLKGNSTLEGENPLNLLYVLYRGIVRTIPSKACHRTLFILSSLLPHTKFPSWCLPEAMGLDRGTFIGSLSKLGAVLRVNYPADLGDRPRFSECLGIYHKSFLDFLTHAFETAEFGVTKADVQRNFRECCYRLYDLSHSNGQS